MTMRKYIIVSPPIHSIRKIMIYSYQEKEQDYVYVYTYDSEKDVPCVADYCFMTLDEAYSQIDLKFNVGVGSSWISIDDPMENCQHDMIAPVKIHGGNENG